MESEDQSSRGTTTARLEHLLDQIRSGNAGAIAEFFAIADERIRLIARRILRGDRGTPHGATDDIVNESSLALSEKLKAGLGGRCSDLRHLMDYLAQIIRNEAIDAARRNSGLKHRTQYPSRPLPPDAVGDVARRLTFHEMIEGLPARQREVVDLYIMCSCTFREIADLIGIGETTAKDEYRRALRHLAREIADPNPETIPLGPTIRATTLVPEVDDTARSPPTRSRPHGRHPR